MIKEWWCSSDAFGGAFGSVSNNLLIDTFGTLSFQILYDHCIREYHYDVTSIITQRTQNTVVPRNRDGKEWWALHFTGNKVMKKNLRVNFIPGEMKHLFITEFTGIRSR